MFKGLGQLGDMAKMMKAAKDMQERMAALQEELSTIVVDGSRFPWTTGSVTVTATARGPHKTVHYARGYDNRNTTTPTGKGTIQLLTPVLTRWLQSALNYETTGSPSPHPSEIVLDRGAKCRDAASRVGNPVRRGVGGEGRGGAGNGGKLRLVPSFPFSLSPFSLVPFFLPSPCLLFFLHPQYR